MSGVSTRMSRGRHEDVTRKLLPWNLGRCSDLILCCVQDVSYVELSSRTLLLQVYDHDELIGHVTYPLAKTTGDGLRAKLSRQLQTSSSDIDDIDSTSRVSHPSSTSLHALIPSAVSWGHGPRILAGLQVAPPRLRHHVLTVGVL